MCLNINDHLFKNKQISLPFNIYEPYGNKSKNYSRYTKSRGRNKSTWLNKIIKLQEKKEILVKKNREDL